ncbi:MAG: CpaF family protein [Candidatus Magasanikbacteria bacterium]|nr:CpaF family protein [Candidatus Magasanikbacteria bacterium]
MSSFSAELIESIHQLLVATLEREGNPRSALTKEILEARLDQLLAVCENARELSFEDKFEIKERIIQRIIGLGPLERLLADPSITEIMVNGLESVFIERAGQLVRADINFTSEAEILQIINRIVSRAGRRIDELSPLVDARLPDGSRVNAIIAPLSQIGPVLTIRRFPAEAYTMSRLIENGTVSEPMANFLQAAVAAKQNIIISGSTGSGKTSTLNALSALIAPSERVISIEDTAEMRLVHPHLVQLEARQANIEGSGEITIRTLLKNALRMRPDRIIVGEVRSGEALDMLQAMNTGHQGSLTTIHANAPEEALLRLETMALMTDIDIPLSAIREQIKSAIHYVVQQERLSGGARRIVAISEMALRPSGGGDTGYALRPLFVYDKIKNVFVGERVLPDRLDLFEQAGVTVNVDWFLN